MLDAPELNVVKSAEGRARLRAKSASGVKLRTHSPEAARRDAARLAAKARAARRRPQA